MQFLASFESYTECYGRLQKEKLKAGTGNKKEHEGRERKLNGKLRPEEETHKKVKVLRGKQ